MPELSHYRSLRARHLDQPICITWCGGLAIADVLAGVGGQPETVTERDFTAAVGAAYDAMPQYAGVALAGGLGEWVLLVEPNGFQGQRESILSSLSREGRALSVFWNIDADTAIAYAERGQLLSVFDPLDPETDIPEPLAPLIDVAAFEDDWEAAALDLAERVTGERLEDGWLAAAHPSMVVQPLPDEVDTEINEEQRAFLANEPRLAAIIADPSVNRTREIAVLAAETACAATGLAGPLVDRAFDALMAPPDSATFRALRAELDQWQKDLIGQAFAEQSRGTFKSDSAADALHRQSLAAGVMSAALDEDPLTAARDTIWRVDTLRLDDIGSRRVGSLWSCMQEIQQQL